MSTSKDKTFSLDEGGQKLALDQLMSGKPLFGKGGAFAPLLQQLLAAALEGELAAHLKEGKGEGADDLAPNRRNGHSTKKVKTSVGTVDLSTPRDRAGSFEPQLVKKRETILADSLEERIIVPKVKAWQSRGLEAVYPIVWLDAMYYKVKSEDSAKVVTRCLYNIVGVRTDGYKEVLGAYVSEAEGGRFWLSVLTDLQARGITDIFIARIDNLSGFEEAIATIFPKTEVPSCIVHQVRNTHKYIAYKDSKEAITDIKQVYKAPTKKAGELALDAFETKWAKTYPAVVKSWRANWGKLSTFFAYPESNQKGNLYDQHHRGLPPAAQKGNQDQRCLSLRYRYGVAEAGVSCKPEH